MVPPGMPDLVQRNRYMLTGRTVIEGKAWSGFGKINKVEFSSDGGKIWNQAILGEPVGEYAWTPWKYEWHAEKPGEYELCVRASVAAGNIFLKSIKFYLLTLLFFVNRQSISYFTKEAWLAHKAGFIP